MVTSSKQDKAFAETMAATITKILTTEDGILLEDALDWIAKELSPEEVFSETQLAAWAERHGLVDGGER